MQKALQFLDKFVKTIRSVDPVRKLQESNEKVLGIV